MNLTNSILFQIFYKYSDNIIIENSFGYDNLIVKIWYCDGYISLLIFYLHYIGTFLRIYPEFQILYEFKTASMAEIRYSAWEL